VKVIKTNWAEFPQQIKELRAQCGDKPSSPLLFRGQRNSNFRLETTLERNVQGRMSFRAFYELITRIGPAVETYTECDVPKYDHELLNTFNNPELFSGAGSFPSGALYRYMVYLRHHGFPSPLLDWSYSPYVAAFFAFKDKSTSAGHIRACGLDNDNKPEDPPERSIFAYCELSDRARGGTAHEPTIHRLGRYVRGHARHFLQQSSYTFCNSFENHWQFDSHMQVFDNGRYGQDYLWKFDFPSAERGKVLRLLDEYNLNAFSLFDSEETLLETMWLREQLFRKANP
jgi:hypothetical protein